MDNKLYHTTISSTGGISSFPILTCPKCDKYKVNMHQHSKSKKCNFDFKLILDQWKKKNNII